ncbi:MAG TPA: cyclic nucleotide-binding domain-containing protein [Intrasporangium sp.]|nr:cyclic nucleotide-binding domain-containing protein [Intrasporangium sp.]
MDQAADAARLKRLERFSGLSDAEIQKIVDHGTRVRIPAHWGLIWEKTPADKAYLILDGEVSVRKGRDEVARLGPGDTVGESAIVAHRLRSASVVSVTELDVLHFTSEAVQQLIDDVPAFRAALEETTRERLGETS